MPGLTIEQLKIWPHRVMSIPNVIPVFIYGLCCLTPAVYFSPPFDLRERFYLHLTGSKLFSLSTPTPGSRSVGVRIWDWTNVYSVVLAQLSLPLGIPLGLFLILGLQDLWTQEVADKVDVAQLIVASIVGAIATNIFLSAQLPRIAVPRIACSFLMGVSPNGYAERYRNSEEFYPGEAKWVHLRLTNVGTIYYSGFTVSCEIPPYWVVPFGVHSDSGESPNFMSPQAIPSAAPPGKPLQSPLLGDYPRPYRVVPGKYQVDFPPQSDPRDTGPGATAVFQIYLWAPSHDHKCRLRLRISANEAGGVAIKDLTLRVQPD